jgi:hypothetical protein
MERSTKLVPIGLTVALWALAAGPPGAGAVQCPGSGAVIDVCITNPTGNPVSGVAISGSYVSNEITCTSASASSYSRTVTVTAVNGATECFSVPTSGGLVTGMYVHRIVRAPQDQHQQMLVLYSDTTRTRVNWTFFPRVITVKTAGDAQTGLCNSTNCTLRQALNTANSYATQSEQLPTLIRFTVSPGTMTQTGELFVGKSSGPAGYITIDGTDSSGNPWIVGDALAAAQGSQDPFPRVVNLNNKTKFVLRGTNNTIKGLAINNSTGGALPDKILVEGSTANHTITAVRLDGGAPASCTSGDDHLLNLTGAGVVVANVEGRSACGNGIDFGGGTTPPQTLRDSWLHHNVGCSNCGTNGGNLAATNSLITRNMIELGGLRASDNSVARGDTVGILGYGVSNVTTSRNVVRNNAYNGIELTASSAGLSLSHDYVCGNGGLDGGISINGVSSSATATGTGLTSTYNSGGGIVFQSSISGGTFTFNDHSAFPTNGLVNLSSVTVSATNNQWRDTSTQIYGPVTFLPVQDPVDTPISLSSSQPTFPSNVLLKGQTIRVQGTGFNAIHGNPLGTEVSPNCSDGIGNLSTSCCRAPGKANTCDTEVHHPLANGGNCVELKTAGGSWVPLSVTAVTPTTIVTEIPDPVFGCVGDAPGSEGEVSVSKRGALGNLIMDDRPYCTNVHQL